MNAIPFRTTSRIAALMASGAVLHTREDPIVVLTRSIEENNAALMERLTNLDARYENLRRDIQSSGVALTPERRDAGGNVIVSAHSRRAQIETRDDDRRDRRDRGRSAGAGDSQNIRLNDREAPEIREEREALGEYIRSGDDEAFRQVAIRAGMSESSDPDGGFLVTPVLSGAIQRRAFDLSPMMRLARQVTIDVGDSFEEPVDASDIGAMWVDEHDDRPPLDTTKLRMLKVVLNEIYTNQPVTQRLLDDSTYNLGAYIETKITDKFARTAGAAFISGNGVGKPEGMLFRATTTEEDGVRDYFTIQHINTGAAGTFAPGTAGGQDALVDLVYSLRAPYRANARWLMNLKTAGVVRKMKDADGNSIWVNGIAQGQPALLLGYPVEIDEEMPDMADGSLSIAFGDIQQAYIIVNRPGVRMLVDPYSAKPNVLFYAYTRVGGQVQNGEAVKLLRFSVSG